MTIFKLNDKIECINPGNECLTKGKVYTVTGVSEYWVLVNSERGNDYWYDPTRFKLYEEKVMFDIKKDKWFIYTPTHEISKLVQNWLFDHGLVWQHHEDTSVRYTSSLYLKLSPFTTGAFCHTDSIDPKYDTSKEIKLTFKTVVDSVEFPELKTEEQKQLDILMHQITDLQDQAAKLQGLINK